MGHIQPHLFRVLNFALQTQGNSWECTTYEPGWNSIFRKHKFSNLNSLFGMITHKVSCMSMTISLFSNSFPVEFLKAIMKRRVYNSMEAPLGLMQEETALCSSKRQQHKQLWVTWLHSAGKQLVLLLKLCKEMVLILLVLFFQILRLNLWLVICT